MRLLQLVLLTSALFLTLSTLAYVFAGGAPKAVVDAKASLVSLWVEEGKKLVFTCSAGVVNLNGKPRVVTAAHCIEDVAKMYRVRTNDGKFHPVLQLEAIEAEEPQDYAVLRSTAVYVTPALKVAPENLAQGDEVFVWHHALGFQALYSSGIFQGVIESLDGDDFFQPVWKMLKTTLEVGPGASGSIVLNERGEAVGIVSRRLPAERYGMMGSILSPMPR